MCHHRWRRSIDSFGCSPRCKKALRKRLHSWCLPLPPRPTRCGIRTLPQDSKGLGNCRTRCRGATVRVGGSCNCGPCSSKCGSTPVRSSGRHTKGCRCCKNQSGPLGARCHWDSRFGRTCHHRACCNCGLIGHWWCSRNCRSNCRPYHRNSHRPAKPLYGPNGHPD